MASPGNVAAIVTTASQSAFSQDIARQGCDRKSIGPCPGRVSSEGFGQALSECLCSAPGPGGSCAQPI
jgi:hypothetical protein